ncbi:hypothetical protein LEP1GSC133_4838 [Leptospira borgpetersenii serovar Pomona str. 200901868]|uniref:Uncharacterized protein n=1 Tax=Leptospira borgpetersenii serovar Pomona str. 200901868 TaxID=1192866 RepID=M6VTH8_LEPBO|nr:hypothetical protein LEP1GSC133_4838 [Leptospira borgpetersenii serovar Pomona str. 200901868]
MQSVLKLETKNGRFQNGELTFLEGVVSGGICIFYDRFLHL